MLERSLGKGGLRVSPVGLGCMGMTGTYGAVDSAEATRALHHAVDSGVTLIDTAQGYGPFVNESFVGEALAGRREKVVLATKIGYRFNTRGPDGTSFTTDRVLDGGRSNILAAIDGSLRRLRTDRIDLLYLHRVDQATPIEETVGAMGELVKAGKARWIGLSEASLRTIRRAHAAHPVSVLQSEYSLWERGVEAEILPGLRELSIGFVAYCPLGRGFLTGSARPAKDYAENDFRRLDPRFQPGNFEANIRLVDVVRAIAARHGATPARVALAWLLSRGEDIAVIPGSERRAFVDDNVAAASLELTAGDLQELDEAFPRGVAQGERWPAWWAKNIDR